MADGVAGHRAGRERRVALLACVALLGAIQALSPAAAAGRADLGLAFSAGVPRGEFADEVDATGWGGNGSVAFAPGSSPISFGADLGFLVYGHETRKEPFSLTIPDVTVDVTTSNNIVLGHLFLRLEPFPGVISPYVDGWIGLKYLYTSTTIESEEGDDEPIAESTNWDDTAFSYGVGGGLHVRLARPGRGENASGESKLKEVLLSVGARHLWGGEADYLKKGSIRRVAAGRVTYDLSHSRTDLLLASIGVTLRF